MERVKKGPVVDISQKVAVHQRFQAFEVFDHRALRLIIDNWDNIPLPQESREPWVIDERTYVPITLLNDYLRRAKPIGDGKATVRVTYQSARGADGHRGRRFAAKALSLQSLPRPVRSTIACDHYHDLDIVNCHPVLLVQACERLYPGLKISVLEAYVKNKDVMRAELMEVAGIDRDRAKQVVLAVMNGGRADYERLAKKPDWLVAFRDEMVNIQSTMVCDPRNRDIVKGVIAKKGDGYNNLGGSVVNRILCGLEDEILMAAIDFLRDRTDVPVENVVLVFDGVMVLRGACDVDAALLRDMEDYVRVKTGYEVEYAEKDMKVDILDLSALELKVEGREAQVAYDDDQASDMFLQIVRDRVRRSGKRVFARSHDKGVWTDDATLVRSIMLVECTRSNIIKVDDRDVPRPYAANVNCARPIVELTLAKLPDDPQFAEKLWQGSIGKLFFQNGVYDFDLGKFRAEDIEKDMTTMRVPRDFPVVDDHLREKMKEVRKRIFEAVFADDQDVDCFLAHTARAIAGRYGDKAWVAVLGERGSGKSIIGLLNQQAWGTQYCVSVISDSFLMERQGAGDEAKKYSWLLDCENARLIMTNEIRVDVDKIKIDGNLIKGKLSSGGDPLLARKNYKDEVAFKLQGRLVMFANDMPPITPADAMENMTLFEMPHAFVDDLGDDPMPFWKKADDTVRDLCREDAAKDAYVMMVIEAYRDHKVAPSAKVKAQTRVFREEGGDEWAVMREGFKVTGNKKDVVSAAKVAAFLSERGVNISAQKARKRLEMMGAKVEPQVVVDGKRCRGYVGLVINENV